MPRQSSGNHPTNIYKGVVAMMQYKVLTQKDRFFAGKFDPEKLESAINSYASEGYIVKAAATASIPSFSGAREEMIIILEREQ
jgi:hypothetical protein